MNLPKFLIGEAMWADEGINATLLAGNPHESTSAHCGAQYAAKKPCLFCRLVCGFIQNVLGTFWPHLKTHCANAWEAEKQMVKDAPPLP